MKHYYTFDEFMREQHMEDYYGTDDDAPDYYELWLTELDGAEIIEYAEAYGQRLTNVLKK